MNSTQNMPQFKIGLETHVAYFLKLQFQKTPCWLDSIFFLDLGHSFARSRMTFWTCPWYLLSAFHNMKFWSSEKSKEVPEMTHWGTASLAVAYLWKAGKPQCRQSGMRPSGVGEGLVGRLSQGMVWERGELPRSSLGDSHHGGCGGVCKG